MPRWTCIHCLAAFDPAARLALCERGCEPEPGTIGSTSLVFDPRETAPSGPRLGLARILSGRVDDHANCPKCGKPSSRWICPECHADLPDEGLDAVASLTLIGPPGSGKSGLARAIARRIERAGTPPAGFVVDPHDEASREILSGTGSPRGGRAILRLRRREGDSVASRWLTLFDLPGSPWEERREAFGREAPFLARSGAIVLVLDPRRLEPVAAEIRRHTEVGVEPGPAAAWRRYQLVDEIRLLGGLFELSGGRLPATVPLAVALTRLGSWAGLASPGTLLRALGPVPEAFPMEAVVDRVLHEEAEAELVRWNGESFLQQLGLKFPTHRFFPIGDPAGGSPYGIEPLFRWCLEGQDWPPGLFRPGAA